MRFDISPVHFCTDPFAQLVDTIVFSCEEEQSTADLDKFTNSARTLVIMTPANTIPVSSEDSDILRLFCGCNSYRSGIKRVIVRGHTHCNLLRQLANPPALFPQWLKRCSGTRQRLTTALDELPQDQRLAVCVYENVVEQLRNLESYPAVRQQCADRGLRLLGWVYDRECDWLSIYDPDAGTFVPPNAIHDLA